MARYAASFASVRNHLMRGDSYLLNLCVATPVETNLTLRHLFRFARAPYRMLLGPDAVFPACMAAAASASLRNRLSRYAGGPFPRFR